LNFLLDTNTVSEPTSFKPETRALAWISSQELRSLHISVATIGEIDFGIARTKSIRRQSELQAWRDLLVSTTGSRLLPLDLPVLADWGRLRARAQAAKLPTPLFDALLAATAELHGLTLVTRNVKDFRGWDGPILNPWQDAIGV
jgi:predicted nucleic acid-binding protein